MWRELVSKSLVFVLSEVACWSQVTRRRKKMTKRRRRRRKKGKGSLRFPTEVATSLPSPGKMRQICSWRGLSNFCIHLQGLFGAFHHLFTILIFIWHSGHILSNDLSLSEYHKDGKDDNVLLNWSFESHWLNAIPVEVARGWSWLRCCQRSLPLDRPLCNDQDRQDVCQKMA